MSGGEARISPMISTRFWMLRLARPWAGTLLVV